MALGNVGHHSNHRSQFEAAGIVLAARRTLSFFAAISRLHSLEGLLFPTLSEAECVAAI